MAQLTLGLPSQPGAEYPNGGEERYWMGKIADSMEAFLSGSGVKVLRISESPEESRLVWSANREGCRLYLSFCSQTAPEDSAGQRKGADVYYQEQSVPGKQAAELFASRLKEIYPEPELAGTRPATTPPVLPDAELPMLLIKLAYRDNPQDEAWLVNSTEEIGKKLAQATAEVLGLPFPHA